MKYIGRAFVVGLAWAAAWVLVGGVMSHLTIGELEPEGIGGPLYAGFLCGSIFAAMGGVASGRRRVSDVPFPQAAAWGAVSGLLVGLLPFVLGDQKASDRPVWVLPVLVMSALTVMSGVSAVASVWIARKQRDGNTVAAIR